MKRIISGIFVLVIIFALNGCARKNTEERIPDTAEGFNSPGYTIAVKVGTTPETAARSVIPDANYVYVDSAADGFTAVKSGRADAYAGNKSQFVNAAKSGITGLEGLTYIKEDVGESSNVAIGISPVSEVKNADLLINGFIAEMKGNGTIDDMITRWEVNVDYTMPDIPLPSNPDKRIRIGTTGLAEPYTFYSNNELCGMDIELMKRFALYANAEIEISVYDWNGLTTACVSGKVDYIFSNLFDTPEKRESIGFSDPYLTVTTVLVVRDENKTGYTSLSELEGKRIGIETGSVYDKIAKEKWSDPEIEYFNDYSTLILALKRENIDSFLADEPIAEQILSQTEGLKVIDEKLANDEYGVVFPKNADGEALRNSFNAFITSESDGKLLEELKTIWFGNDESLKTLERADALPAINGVLRYAATMEVDGFNYMKDGQPVGLELDMITRFCKAMGYGLNIEIVSFDALLPGITSGKFDVVADTLSITEERRQSVYFSEPYYYGGVRAVVLSGDSSGADEADGLFDSLAQSFRKNFVVENRWQLIVRGIVVTLVIAVCSGIAGIIIGFGLCLIRLGRSKVLKTLVKGLTKILQGTPIVVLLMIFYYVIFNKANLDGVIVSIIAFGLNFGACAGEIMLSGIGAVDKGQYEASAAMGFTSVGSFVNIILPQAAGHFLPVLKGEFISLVKMTSVVGYVAVQDLTKMSDIIRSRTYEAFFPLIAVAFIYFMISWALTALLGLIEIKTDPKRHSLGTKGINTAYSPSLYTAKTAAGSPDDEVIRAEHLKKVYPTVTPIKDVNAVIRRGEVITVIGPSGTGKSTFLRMLNHIESPTEGSITVLGTDMSIKKNQTAMRRKMGMVFQSFNLFPHLSVAENIMLAPMKLLGLKRGEAYERAVDLLSLVGLAEKASSLPDELSGGQKQRVAIARTLAMEPEIILFDEPTSALDPTMVSEVLGVINLLAKQGMTMIIVTHEMRFAREVSTRIFYMDKGLVYEEGTPEQIFESPQKELTRSFIFRIRAWEYEIHSKQFDYYGMNGKLEEFCQRQFLSKKQLNHITLVVEELVMQCVLPAYKDGSEPYIKLRLDCGEEGKTVRLSVSYKGLESDPLTGETNELSLMLLKKYTAEVTEKHTEKSSEFEILT